MTQDAVTACRATITKDSIEPDSLVTKIVQAANSGDTDFLKEIAFFAASYVDRITESCRF